MTLRAIIRHAVFLSPEAFNRSAGLIAIAIGFGLPTPAASANGSAEAPDVRVLLYEAFNDLDAWAFLPSDGVTGAMTLTPGADGTALRLDHDFTAGAGYAIIRRETPIELPGNFRISFDLRGNGAANDLELKFVGPSGDDVWWVNRRRFEPPRDWTNLRSKRRHFEFAWGPSEGAPLTGLSAIEFAVTAAEGGVGTTWIDNLRIESIPADRVYNGTPTVAASSGTPAPLPAVAWSPEADDPEPTLTVDFGQWREFGGLSLGWAPGNVAPAYAIELSDDGVAWREARRVDGGNGGFDHHPMTESESRYLRVRVLPDAAAPAELRSLRIRPLEFARDTNAFLNAVAAETQREAFPPIFHGRQTYWTLAAAPQGVHEAIVSEFGVVEPFKGSYSIEPFIFVDTNDGRRGLTWTDADPDLSLAQGSLPIPSVTWRTEPIDLKVTAAADPDIDGTQAVLYELTNRSDATQRGELALAIRPMQVLRPWQFLNQFGGHARVRTFEGVGTAAAVVNGRDRIALEQAGPGTKWGATTWNQSEIGERLLANDLPSAPSVEDPDALASGAWTTPFELAPGETMRFPLTIERSPTDARLDTAASIIDRAEAAWDEAIGAVRLDLPPSAVDLAKTYRAQLAYILANRDGPAIQPGSRTYERSWIRDGALTALALLGAGRNQDVADYIDWYAPNQYDNGKIPCVVDTRGPDPVPEHDSPGQFIFLIASYHRFTGDTSLVERHYDRVVATADFIDALIAERSTPEYRTATGIKGACYGLVPESISHEGYSAKPMHSYWDGFFVIRGYRDAAYLARTLGKEQDARRFQQALRRYRDAMYNSIRASMQIHGIDYVPGCVELGDFDATSTSIGVYPIGELGRIPEPALTRTFERYLEFFDARREGTLEWGDYTPYELRIVAALIIMGQPDRAHDLLDFFMADRRPAGWRHWAEVVHNGVDTPRFIGDMPHTWVGSGFANSVRTMFAYEDETAGRLVLAAGVTEAWTREANGVGVTELPTWYGPLSYRLTADANATRFTLEPGLRSPPRGIVLRVPGSRAIASAVDQAGQSLEVDSRDVTVPPAGASVIIRYAD
ncbi:MAG: discoidin domain-containing protein [Planctomycetota bacterium]